MIGFYKSHRTLLAQGCFYPFLPIFGCNLSWPCLCRNPSCMPVFIIEIPFTYKTCWGPPAVLYINSL
jgi:hypothetical protein